MKYLVLFSFLLLINPFRIAEINSLKEEAKEAFNKSDYNTAITKYRRLTETLNVKEDRVLLNMAHAHFLAKDTSNALSTYQLLTTSSIKTVQSKAHQQIGVIRNKQGNPQEALEHFKKAILADGNNQDAQYNYELLKKYLEYPEIILSRTQLLVKQRKYRQARDFLEKEMEESRRIRKFTDYKERIETIITIDSLAKS